MSCADVCLSMEYDGNNEFHSSQERRARKSYVCCECFDTINPRDKYEYVVGKTNDFWTYRTCLPCAEIRKTFCCNGWIYGELWNSIRLEMFPHWTKDLFGLECLARLETDTAIAKMREQFNDYLRNYDL